VIINPLTKIERVVRAKGRAWFNNENVAIRFNGTLQDITTQALARNEIEQIVEERTHLLNKSNADLTQFAYVASHDLQEPARKISTFTDMLLKRVGENLDEQSKEYLKKIDNSSDRMLSLIRGILTISKISDHRYQFDDVDLNIVLQDAKNDFEVLLNEKNCKVESHHLPTIQAIPIQMNQLFSNLISNALKFSVSNRATRITITCEVLSKTELSHFPDLVMPGTYYKISFIYNGIGFEQKHAIKIFDIFQRLHGKSEFPGTGIGLAICKKIAENHHGHINANSTSGSGATFEVILPAQQ
jgi:light-regulated signal transduction histidine kinase (bacteriophytochrome)